MDKALFFDAVRSPLFRGSLSAGQVAGMETLLAEFSAARWPLGWAAYALATAKWETAHTMQPIAEYGRGAGRKYGARDPETGQVYYGRGYVQLTWRFNYSKAGEILGVDLVNNPDLAMRPDIAAKILIAGMREGWFTTRKLADYIGPVRADYVGARKIISGTDHAADIARIAGQFETALRLAGYAPAAGGATVARYPPRPKPPAPIAPPAEMAATAGPPAKPGFWSRLAAAFTRAKG